MQLILQEGIQLLYELNKPQDTCLIYSFLPLNPFYYVIMCLFSSDLLNLSMNLR